jgi:hypothetical protein
MNPAVVIDTNVAVVANGRAAQAGPHCVLACIDSLEEARQRRLILLDDGMRILDEYRQNLSLRGQPGPGDAFFKWLWDNQANTEHCLRVPITPRGDRGPGFEEFPDDDALACFDSEDRKFVAVGLGYGRDFRIWNASDTDWWHFRHELTRHGVEVEFLCPGLMTAGAR